ncbi:ferritin [Nocardia higoensis]|uniref:Ferritin n=1 Tax=Nocardia higoensis TaxID=228599 RepID=A0ABS0DIQ2_9NOCA|nr:ferritin-like domain-containing protein [Nocardia higoensis]MBF6356834.1 ferritin [Nocardia higoensis]
MTDSTLADVFPVSLREHVRRGFAIAQQYLAAAVYFDAQRLPQLAAQCYRRHTRHRENALRVVRYLLDRDLEIRVGGVDEPRSEFESPRAAVEILLDAERVLTDACTMLVDTARSQRDYLGEQFATWFLAEQVENVAAMTTLLDVFDRENGTLFDVEEFVDRDMPAPGNADPAAPRIAGQALGD